MRILFLHPSSFGQFSHLAKALAQDDTNQVVFGTQRKAGKLPKVSKAIYSPVKTVRAQTDYYLYHFEREVHEGQAVYHLCTRLKSEGFVPDVVYGHSGWGSTLYIKDVFPQAKLLCYCEWFYHAHGSNFDFNPSDPLRSDDETQIRTKNASKLLSLVSCDRGLSPTYYQHCQFPREFHSKITVRHDGIDTEFFKPKPGAKLVLPRIDLDLSEVDELITYVGRGMEPYRGFPQFMAAVGILQQRRPRCHVVVVGDNQVVYSKPLPDGKTYKELMLEKVPLDLDRVHFTGLLPYSEYLKVLQASSVHIYLTYPFVLSWSILESMATGCLVVGSNTAPVIEVIENGVNGLLVDFFSPEDIADRVEEALDNPDKMAGIRENARETILQRYDLAKLLPQHIQWIQED
ncbi:glycosyltransferase [Moorena producens]|uniref:glycosyltransferase n=1 Tax=Moorena producens TaxID=1155739 RepID=UPI003C75E41A